MNFNIKFYPRKLSVSQTKTIIMDQDHILIGFRNGQKGHLPSIYNRIRMNGS